MQRVVSSLWLLEFQVTIQRVTLSLCSFSIALLDRYILTYSTWQRCCVLVLYCIHICIWGECVRIALQMVVGGSPRHQCGSLSASHVQLEINALAILPHHNFLSVMLLKYVYIFYLQGKITFSFIFLLQKFFFYCTIILYRYRYIR